MASGSPVHPGRRSDIRAAVLIPRYWPVFGGAETQCRSLLQVVRRQGPVHVPFILTRRIRADLSRRDEVDGVPVIRLGRAGVNRWAEYAFYLHVFVELLRRRRDFDILHCHATSNIGAVATLASLLIRKPVLLKLSSNGEFVSGLGNYSGVVAHESGVRGKFRRTLARFMGRHATIVALNAEGRRELTLGGAVRAHTLTNGVDRSRFAPPTAEQRQVARDRYGWSKDEFVFVYTGRFVEVKGVDLLLAAFCDIWDAGAPVVRLCLIGSGAQQYESVDDIVQRALSDPRSRLSVFPPTDDVIPYLHAADAFVFASRREGMPNAVLEALAVGLPCVVSDIAPHRAILDDNPRARAWSFRSGEAGGLRRAVERCVTEVRTDETRSELDSSYDIECVAERYLSLYETLTSQARATGNT